MPPAPLDAAPTTPTPTPPCLAHHTHNQTEHPVTCNAATRAATARRLSAVGLLRSSSVLCGLYMPLLHAAHRRAPSALLWCHLPPSWVPHSAALATVCWARAPMKTTAAFGTRPEGTKACSCMYGQRVRGRTTGQPGTANIATSGHRTDECWARLFTYSLRPLSAAIVPCSITNMDANESEFNLDEARETLFTLQRACERFAVALCKTVDTLHR